jgi:hypothetical protein
MANLNVQLPNSLHNSVRKLSEKDGISVERFVASAVAEKVAALMTESYLEERAARGERSAYEAALAQVPDAEPEPHDLLRD